jgi:uncharacterized protein with HEPN domain
MPRDLESNRINDRIRYEHIRTASQDVVTLTTGRTRTELDSDMPFRRALVHAMTEIGEAAARMSEEGRRLGPGAPWGSIVEMRNILVHVYWSVRLERVWDVAINHVPSLIAVAEKAIQQLPLPDDVNDIDKE